MYCLCRYKDFASHDSVPSYKLLPIDFQGPTNVNQSRRALKRNVDQKVFSFYFTTDE